MPKEWTDKQERPLAAFGAHRSLLFTVAYEMLGSAAHAEDVLQETCRAALVIHVLMRIGR